MNKPMTKEQAHILLRAVLRLQELRAFMAVRISIHGETVERFKRFNACSHGLKKLRQRIIQAMAPEPVVVKTTQKILDYTPCIDCPNPECPGHAPYYPDDNYCAGCGHPITWQLDTEDTE